MNKQNTIAAISTPQGIGGIGIIRISGNKAYNIISIITKKKTIQPNIINYSNFYIKDKKLDQGIVLYFKKPHSFTGEDVIEIQGHGSPIVLNTILNYILTLGAVLSKPGEFSKRAFLNNKIDLIQAEAIADIIEASSEKAAFAACQSLHGVFSNKINTIVQDLISLRMYIEASIDFSEEDIEYISIKKIKIIIHQLEIKINNIINKTKEGIILQKGINVVIVGKVNVGKSSLINCLTEQQTSIVTNIPGTTRDSIKESIHINGIPLNIIDTAGIRYSDNIVEKKGIEKSIQNINTANLILFVQDITSKNIINFDNFNKNFLNNSVDKSQYKNIEIINVFNKIDLINDNTIEDIKKKYHNYNICIISAKKNIGINNMKQQILNIIFNNQSEENIYTARSRHIELLKNAYTIVKKIQSEFYINNIEILAEELLNIQNILNHITGKFTSDDLLGVIFNSFCIGK